MTATAQAKPVSSERLAGLLDTLELTPFQKELLRDRWLDQVGWMSRQARHARRWYLGMRIPVVMGGVAIPGLISISLLTTETGAIPQLRIITFVISLTVAILAALEEVFHFGERWRHYRRTSERLKSLGWQFMMLTGEFRRYATHADAFHAFTTDVENALNEDVEGYLTEVAADPGSQERHEVYH
ncbi:MAG TPA: DUF4231 domain-containing protein [Candidatus Limnocylindrales bacterium]|nr:DUF4231 domain-containing protein [Candidatus Limnocylindrales bacterium]